MIISRDSKNYYQLFLHVLIERFEYWLTRKQKKEDSLLKTMVFNERLSRPETKT
jgi:hypothetical protein